MKQTVTPGRIVLFSPNGNEDYTLPNNMEIAPAIVTQVFKPNEDSVELINATLFLANPGAEAPVLQIWSVRSEDEAIEGIPFWSWPKRD